MKNTIREYQISKMLENILAKQLEAQRKESAELLRVIRTTCKHEAIVHEIVRDYLGRYEYTACLCEACGEYLGRKHC